MHSARVQGAHQAETGRNVALSASLLRNYSPSALRTLFSLTTSLYLDVTLLNASSSPSSPHETHRLPLLRPLDPVAAVADAVGGRRAAAIDRACGGGRGARRRRGLFPGASLRPPARLAVPAARRLRRAHQADRDRHRGHRHALREPALHGGGRRRRRPHRRRAAAARHLARLAGAGDRRLALLRLRAGGGA